MAGRLPTRVAVFLTGNARCGKDTVGRILHEKHGFVPLSFAQPLKELSLRSLHRHFPRASLEALRHGLYEDKEAVLPDTLSGFTGRSELQQMATDLREVLGRDVFIRAVVSEVERRGCDRVCLTDMRLPEEYEILGRLLRERGFATAVWRVVRPQGLLTQQLEAQARAHETETALSAFRPHLEVRNVGTLDDLGGEVAHSLQTGAFDEATA